MDKSWDYLIGLINTINQGNTEQIKKFNDDNQEQTRKILEAMYGIFDKLSKKIDGKGIDETIKETMIKTEQEKINEIKQLISNDINQGKNIKNVRTNLYIMYDKRLVDKANKELLKGLGGGFF